MQASNVPVCEHCGSGRTFEMQLVPMLLCALELRHTGGDFNADNILGDVDVVNEIASFSTVAIYTCANSCWVDGPAIARAHPQFVVEHTVMVRDMDELAVHT